MDLGIAGKHALILGASRGIGRGIANALAAEGVNLLLVSRNKERLQSVCDELQAEYSIQAIYIEQDLGENNASAEILGKIEKSQLQVDILVCVTGGPAPGSALNTSAEEFKKQFDSMLTPCIEITRKLVMSMVEKRWGRVITVTSSGVILPLGDLVISNTLRSGLVNWSKTLSNEIAPYGVTVNVLVPGKIETERLIEINQARAKKKAVSVAQVTAESQARIPMQRHGTVDEFASVAAFLASKPASYITGSCLRVDGGLVSCI